MSRRRLSVAGLCFGVALAALNFWWLRDSFDAAFDALDGAPTRSRSFESMLRFVPAFDAILIAFCRLRLPERRTPRVFGFIVGGCIGIMICYILDFYIPGIQERVFESLVGPTAQGFMAMAILLLGNVEARTSPTVLQLVILLFGVLMPAVIQSIPPLLTAVLGARLAGRPVVKPAAVTH